MDKSASNGQLETRSSSPGSEVVRKADADAVKMFCGQIPKEWTEGECRALFEEFGPVFEVNVLRDKRTNNSRGKNCTNVLMFEMRSNERQAISTPQPQMFLICLSNKRASARNVRE